MGTPRNAEMNQQLSEEKGQVNEKIIEEILEAQSR
jgi:hypothetical protein